MAITIEVPEHLRADVLDAIDQAAQRYTEAAWALFDEPRPYGEGPDLEEVERLERRAAELTRLRKPLVEANEADMLRLLGAA